MIQYDGQGSGDDFFGTFWYESAHFFYVNPAFQGNAPNACSVADMPRTKKNNNNLLKDGRWPQASPAWLQQQPRWRPRRPHGHPRLPLRLSPAVVASTRGGANEGSRLRLACSHPPARRRSCADGCFASLRFTRRSSHPSFSSAVAAHGCRGGGAGPVRRALAVRSSESHLARSAATRLGPTCVPHSARPRRTGSPHADRTGRKHATLGEA